MIGSNSPVEEIVDDGVSAGLNITSSAVILVNLC